jgi:hypothetical protein
MAVTRLASAIVRRSSSAAGEKPLSSFSFRARSSTDPAPGPLDPVAPELRQRRQGPAPGSWNQHQSQSLFCPSWTCPVRGSFRAELLLFQGTQARGIWPLSHILEDAGLSGPGGRRKRSRAATVGDPARHRGGNLVQEFTRPSSVLRLCPSAAGEQVHQIRLRLLQTFTVGLAPPSCGRMCLGRRPPGEWRR